MGAKGNERPQSTTPAGSPVKKQANTKWTPSEKQPTLGTLSIVFSTKYVGAIGILTISTLGEEMGDDPDKRGANVGRERGVTQKEGKKDFSFNSQGKATLIKILLENKWNNHTRWVTVNGEEVEAKYTDVFFKNFDEGQPLTEMRQQQIIDTLQEFVDSLRACNIAAIKAGTSNDHLDWTTNDRQKVIFRKGDPNTCISMHMMKMDIANLVLSSVEFRAAYDITDSQLEIIKATGPKPHPWDGKTEEEVEEDLEDKDKLARMVCLTVNDMLFSDDKNDIADLVAKLTAPPPPAPTLQAPKRGIL